MSNDDKQVSDNKEESKPLLGEEPTLIHEETSDLNNDYPDQQFDHHKEEGKDNKEDTTSSEPPINPRAVIHEIGNENLLPNIKYNISFPSDTIERTAHFISNTDTDAIRDNDVDKKWIKTVSAAGDNNIPGDWLQQAAERDNAIWDNEVDVDGNSIGISVPKSQHIENKVIGGNRAKAVIFEKLGIGAYVSIPLWHSGFHITITPPTESQIIDIYRQYASDLVTVGRSTNGIIYSNTSVIAIKVLVNLIFERGLVHSTSIKDWKSKDLTKLIKITDLYPLLLGLLKAQYPRGFNYDRSCIADPNECRHTVSKKIDFSKLLYVDKAVLTDNQKAHMKNRKPESITEEEVLSYQNGIKTNTSVRYDIGKKAEIDSLYINTKVPTINDEIEIGLNWISTTEDMAVQVLEEESEEEKKSAIWSYTNASIMMEMSHWVDSIEVDSLSIPDRVDVNNNLTMLSSDDTIRESFYDSVNKYISNATLAMVAIPAYKCPACGKDQSVTNNTNKVFDNIIPINVLNTFFNLTEYRVKKIAQR